MHRSTEKRQNFDVQSVMKSLLNLYVRQLKDRFFFFLEESKECKTPRDRLLIHREESLKKVLRDVCWTGSIKEYMWKQSWKAMDRESRTLPLGT